MHSQKSIHIRQVRICDSPSRECTNKKKMVKYGYGIQHATPTKKLSAKLHQTICSLPCVLLSGFLQGKVFDCAHMQAKL